MTTISGVVPTFLATVAGMAMAIFLGVGPELDGGRALRVMCAQKSSSISPSKAAHSPTRAAGSISRIAFESDRDGNLETNISIHFRQQLRSGRLNLG